MAAHEVKIRIMKTVSEGTKEIILNRVRKKNIEEKFLQNSALALMHGDVCEMIYASDLAQKTSSVEVFEIPGSCPQHMTCLGILGDVSAVEAAVQRIRKELENSL
ncbi:MAG: BMC domain-containing protein [Eubacteriales bacterium]|nr:BMC domain-containing protein [Eubacteriales bacterium]